MMVWIKILNGGMDQSFCKYLIILPPPPNKFGGVMCSLKALILEND